MESIWSTIKADIRGKIPGHFFRMWLEPLKFIRREADTVVLSCPNNFSRKRIWDLYRELIEAEFSRASGETLRLSLEVANGNGGRPLLESAPFALDPQRPLPSLNFCPYSGRYLRKDFTFDQFVVGENNDFAYSASLSMASRKSNVQNSLYLLSQTGMGKSHLSQAIGHHILHQFPGDRVFYITAEDFANEMVHSLRQGSIATFKEKYRQRCDVLLLEDIHFLSGKERTQVELALTLDTLFDAGKKLIFTSSYLPSDIPKMDDKLTSRFSSGLISSIESPGFRTRVRILKQKCQAQGYHIADEVIDYLADELQDNVRQLESGLHSVHTKASLLGVPASRELAASVVRNIASQKKRITIEVIKRLVCSHFKISTAEIASRSRKQAVVRPRQIAFYLARNYTDQPLQAIGKSFNRYHATVLHSIGIIERGIKENSAMQQQVAFFCKRLESGKF
jgi:chromosomal replication initiator protein